MRRLLFQAVVPAYVLFCLLLGGSGQGIWRELVLQLIALVLIGCAGWMSARREPSNTRQPLLSILALGIVALVTLQFVPLPPAVWVQLPGRDFLVVGFQLLGLPLPWLPLSLSPHDSLTSALALLPPVATLLGMLQLHAYRSDWCAAVLLGATLIGIVLGALQTTAGGPYLYPIHNAGAAAGLFANNNHMASLLVVTIPFLAALAGSSLERKDWISRLSPALAGAVLVGLGLMLNGSTAAMVLALPVALSSAAVAVPRLWSQRGLILGSTGLAAVLTISLAAVLSTNGWSNVASLADRRDIFQRTWHAIVEFMPVGSGLGTFQRVYPMFESPGLVNRWYVNHAHNDYLEVVLETGLPGVLLVGLFLCWWCRQSVRLWRASSPNRLALAASIASAALLLHSAVDYPLRTSALAAVFAMCLGLMTSLQVRTEAKLLRRSRHLTLESEVSA